MRGDHVDVVVDHSPLKRERWVFWLRVDTGSVTLNLDEYWLEHRETTRKRNWTPEKAYLRIGDTRRLPFNAKITSDDVPITPEVEAEAKRQIVDAVNELEIVRWEKR